MNGNILHIPTIDIFDGDWEMLFSFLDRKGNPLWSYGEHLNFTFDDEILNPFKNLIRIERDLSIPYSINETIDLPYLEYVGGELDLRSCWNLISLGSLKYVGGGLDLRGCTSLESTGNLEYVGGNLYLHNCKLGDLYSDDEIRNMFQINEDIFRDY